MQRYSPTWSNLSALGLLFCLSGCLTDAPYPALRLPDWPDVHPIDSMALDGDPGGDAGMMDRSVLMLDSTVDGSSDPDAGPDTSVPKDAMGGVTEPKILMTELMVRNVSYLPDEDGEFHPWVEVYNTSYQSVDLADYQLAGEVAGGPAWQFPRIDLGPTEYRLVFMSGKDRVDPNGELHSSFGLNGMNDYLELRRMSDGVGQVIDGWPEQQPDRSYGIPMTIQRQPLFETGDRMRYQVPMDDTVDDVWFLPQFVDDHWLNVSTAVGSDSTPMNQRGILVADSAEQWSENGQQDSNGWVNGYYDLTNDPNRSYGLDDFIAFPNDGQAHGPTNFWDGVRWRFPNADPPWTLVGRRSVHPNGTNNGAEHWPIRRWVSRIEGRVILEWILRKADLGSDGVTGYLMHRGERIDEAAIAGNDADGFRREVVLEDVQIGDAIDFAMGPVGPNGNTDDYQDRSSLVGRAWNSHSLTAAITSPIDLAGQAGLYLRTQFEVDVNPEALTRLRLNVRYDDGFILYINGRQALNQNGPDGLSFDALATEDRDDTLGQVVENISLQNQLLQQGANTLAIHVMNSHVDDGRIFMDPVIEWFEVSLEIQADDGGRKVPVYRVLPTPTPAIDNVP